MSFVIRLNTSSNETVLISKTMSFSREPFILDIPALPTAQLETLLQVAPRWSHGRKSGGSQRHRKNRQSTAGSGRLFQLLSSPEVVRQLD